ncbi:MAG TPA: pyridoxamine 5'-phosphate oxidase [Candidatus Dormibacteraeota bacterium]
MRFEEDLDPDPVIAFGSWFAEAQRAGVPQSEAMALATTTPDGRPSVRMVLLKGWGPDGFVWFTGYTSRKGGELAANPRAALLFFWQPQGRQVRIEGAVAKTTEEASRLYFQTRPVGSQVAAAVSRQSRPIGSREELERAYAELAAQAGEGTLPLPAHWGGYVLRPDAFEFWEHRDNRLHDRLRYEREGAVWTRVRLQP